MDTEPANDKWFENEENQTKLNAILGNNGVTPDDRQFWLERSRDAKELNQIKQIFNTDTTESVSASPTREVFNQSLQDIKQDLPKNTHTSGIIQPLTYDLGSLLKKNFPPIAWQVEKLIPASGLVALSGLPGGGKSWITEHLALAVSSGTYLFGKFETDQGKVLVIDKENSEGLIQIRFRLLGGLEGLEVCFLNREFFIENEPLVLEITKFIQESKVKLVILDSLIRIYRNKDENSSNDMAEVFRQLKKFQDAGAAVVFTHHHRKQSIMGKNVASESMRGSSDILASVDCHLAVDKVEDGIKITQTKLRQEIAIKPFKIRLEGDGQHLDLNFIGEMEEDKEKVEEAKTDIYEALEEGEISRSDLVDRFKGVYGTKTVDGALKTFTEDEVIIRVGERGKKLYRRAGTEPEGSLL